MTRRRSGPLGSAGEAADHACSDQDLVPVPAPDDLQLVETRVRTGARGEMYIRIFRGESGFYWSGQLKQVSHISFVHPPQRD